MTLFALCSSRHTHQHTVHEFKMYVFVLICSPAERRGVYAPPSLSQGYLSSVCTQKCKSKHLPSAACLSSQVPLFLSSMLPLIILLTVVITFGSVVVSAHHSHQWVRSVDFCSRNLLKNVRRRSLARRGLTLSADYAACPSICSRSCVMTLWQNEHVRCIRDNMSTPAAEVDRYSRCGL